MVGYSYPGQIITPRKTVKTSKEPTDTQGQELCNLYSWFLGERYKGYTWNVTMMGEMVFVRNMSLDTENGIGEHVGKFDNNGHYLTMVGGEILERYKMPRGPRDQAKYLALIRDIKGNAYPDL